MITSNIDIIASAIVIELPKFNHLRINGVPFSDILRVQMIQFLVSLCVAE